MKAWLRLWLPTLIWMIFIFWLSSIPKLELIHEPIWNLITRKAGHIFEYLVLLLLFNRSFKNKKTLLSFILTFLYAISDEVHQIFVPLRSASPIDVLVDCIGIILGLLYLKRRASRKD